MTAEEICLRIEREALKHTDTPEEKKSFVEGALRGMYISYLDHGLREGEKQKQQSKYE